MPTNITVNSPSTLKIASNGSTIEHIAAQIQQANQDYVIYVLDSIIYTCTMENVHHHITGTKIEEEGYFDEEDRLPFWILEFGQAGLWLFRSDVVQKILKTEQ